MSDDPTQGMSEARLAACRNLPQLIRRHTWTAAEDAADAIRDLTAEVERLRKRLLKLGEVNREVVYENVDLSNERDQLCARLDEIGKTSIQWGVRYTGGVDGTGADCSQEEDPIDYCDDQADATQLAAHTPGAIPVYHVRGGWRTVEQEADDA